MPPGNEAESTANIVSIATITVPVCGRVFEDPSARRRSWRTPSGCPVAPSSYAGSS
jgi:hypothetical protein